MIYGAILGDIIGSRFEFDRPNWRRDFELFTKENEFTDDTVMTIAVARALMSLPEDANERTVKSAVVNSMRKYMRRYPDAGYGAAFSMWVMYPIPYNSFGNGSAMRVSAAGWLYDDLDRTREVARWTAEVSHNHPEGIKGAEAIASAIFLARTGHDKDYIATYVIEEFGYDLSMTVDDLIPRHEHNETCMDSVPKALIAFLEGEDFESVIRNAVAMGGDTDTIAAIAGSVAEAMYDIPEEVCAMACDTYLDLDLAYDVDEIENRIGK